MDASGKQLERGVARDGNPHQAPEQVKRRSARLRQRDLHGRAARGGGLAVAGLRDHDVVGQVCVDRNRVLPIRPDVELQLPDLLNGLRPQVKRRGVPISAGISLRREQVLSERPHFDSGIVQPEGVSPLDNQAQKAAFDILLGGCIDRQGKQHFLPALRAHGRQDKAGDHVGEELYGYSSRGLDVQLHLGGFFHRGRAHVEFAGIIDGSALRLVGFDVNTDCDQLDGGFVQNERALAGELDLEVAALDPAIRKGTPGRRQAIRQGNADIAPARGSGVEGGVEAGHHRIAGQVR